MTRAERWVGESLLASRWRFAGSLGFRRGSSLLTALGLALTSAWLFLLAARVAGMRMEVTDEGLHLVGSLYEWYLWSPWAVRDVRLHWEDVQGIRLWPVPNELAPGGVQENIEALVVEMGVCERTVHRDLGVLREAGIDCDYVADRGGYVLRGDWRFTIKYLDDEELLGQAIATALTSAKGLDVGQGAAPTTRKLRATARESARRLPADAERVIAVLDLKLADHEGHREVFRTAQNALIEKSCLEGTYASPHQSREKRSTLHPIRLCLVEQAWYLIARPEGSSHPVTYRVARFRSLKAVDRAADVPEEFDLRAYFGDAWAVYRGSPSCEVEVRFVPEAADLVTETIWHHTQQARRHEDGSVTLSFRVDGLEEVARWLLGWAGWAQVIRPAELRSMVVEDLQRGLALNTDREGLAV